jgi:hypothetical protein
LSNCLIADERDIGGGKIAFVVAKAALTGSRGRVREFAHAGYYTGAANGLMCDC